MFSPSLYRGFSARVARAVLGAALALVIAPAALRAQLAVNPAYPDTPHAEASVVDSITRVRVAALEARCKSKNITVELRCLTREYRMSGDTLRRLEARLAALRGGTPRPVPTVIASMSSTRPTTPRLADAPRGWRSNAGMLLVGLGGVAGWFDRDIGGYAEPWSARSTWTGQDKQAHGGMGFGLGATVGARWTCAAGAAFELVQGARGYASVPDGVVTCASAIAGAGLRRLLAR